MQRRAKKQGQVLSIGEVASALGMPPTTIQGIERRAIRKCRAYMATRGIAISDLIDDAAIPIGIDTTHAEARFDAAADHEAMTC